MMIYIRGRQLAAHHSMFSGLWKHSKKSSNLKFLYLITVNVSVDAEANLN